MNTKNPLQNFIAQVETKVKFPEETGFKGVFKTSVDHIKEMMREIMLSIMQCEDELLASFTSNEQRAAIARSFEDLRERVTMVYVRTLRRGRQGAFYEYLPSIFRPKISDYDDKVKRWMKHLDSLLERYSEVVKRFREQMETGKETG